ncbi:Uncharacterized protein Fot_23177 [Forsythia ovata]|uniref:Uncharacterized protein n=1 Tax=Forsythia ovata TaxID=205694 RepID=A0ABD1UZT8_9LAMI
MKAIFCCSEDECTYFKWDNSQPSGEFVEGQSSSVGLDKSVAKEINEDFTSMFKMLASLSEEKDVEISLNLTIRKGQGKGHELDIRDIHLENLGISLEIEENNAEIIEEEVVNVINLKPMKDHIDLDTQVKKSFRRGFWAAASVFSKKWQNWMRK